MPSGFKLILTLIFRSLTHPMRVHAAWCPRRAPPQQNGKHMHVRHAGEGRPCNVRAVCRDIVCSRSAGGWHMRPRSRLRIFGIPRILYARPQNAARGSGPHNYFA